jgi:site-specific DNA recombinase
MTDLKGSRKVAHMQTKQHLMPDKDCPAVIYCRVSDRKQKTEGHGLESQEHRCRQYAEERGYSVEMVFTDDFTGGGDFMKRPAMRALIAYLASESGQNYVVIFDDLKRLARDTKFHWTLREKLDAFDAIVESPNYKFDNSPEGRFVETMFAAQGQLEREQNSRQVVQKMTARLEKGYYVFHPPIGYRYEKDKAHGKLLVRVEPVASIIAEALEGYASGRFGSQVEVRRFLESKPEFPKSGTSGYVHPSKVKDMLMKPIYAGHVEAPSWNVSLRKGHHEPLISFAAHQRIQEILSGAVYAPARKDINEDFPLRGFVLCDDCEQPMTSCWSKGRNKHYPYYLCDTPTCASKRKSIRRADIEDGAEVILRNLQPAKHLLGLARAMFVKAWDMRLSEAHRAKDALHAQISSIDSQIEKLLDRIVESSSATVVKACETRIDKLERQKFVLVEQAEQVLPPKGHHDEFIEPVFEFLANPCYLYEKGSIALKRTVLKLVFAEPLRYSRKEGYRTAKNTFPFKVLGDISTPKCEMVGDPGIEPGVRLRERVTVSCHTLRPVAH